MGEGEVSIGRSYRRPMPEARRENCKNAIPRVPKGDLPGADGAGLRAPLRSGGRPGGNSVLWGVADDFAGVLDIPVPTPIVRNGVEDVETH